MVGIKGKNSENAIIGANIQKSLNYCNGKLRMSQFPHFFRKNSSSNESGRFAIDIYVLSFIVDLSSIKEKKSKELKSINFDVEDANCFLRFLKILRSRSFKLYFSTCQFRDLSRSRKFGLQ